MSYTLRPYQQEAVDLAIKYMRKNSRECKKLMDSGMTIGQTTMQIMRERQVKP